MSWEVLKMLTCAFQLYSYDCMRITFQEPGDVCGWGKRLNEIIKYLSLQTLLGLERFYFFFFEGVYFSRQVYWAILCRFLFRFLFFKASCKFFLAFNEHRLHCLAGLSEFLSISNILKIDFLHPTCCLSSPVIAGLLSYKITQCSRTCHWSKVSFDPCTNLVSHSGRVAAISAQIVRDCRVTRGFAV